MLVVRNVQAKGFCSRARTHLFGAQCQALGKPLSQVDDGYLRWVQTEEWRKAAKVKAGTKVSVQLLLADLKTCSRTQDLQRGKKVHAEAVACGHDSNIYVLSTLVRMYAKCRSIVDARRVFDSIKKPDVVCWTALLLGYVENGDGLAALDLFSRMKASGCAPDSITYLAALKACMCLAADGGDSGKKTCLEWGKKIHLEIGSFLDHYIQSTLIDMYAKCGSMVDARQVFDSIQKPDVVSWTTLLLGYAENGEGRAALDLFSMMKASGCPPDPVAYVAVLKSCTSLVMEADGGGKKKCLQWGREIHLEIGSNLNHYVQNTLIDMYAKCGSMVEARRVFDSIRNPDVVSWNALCLGYAENGEGLLAVDMFSRMKASGCAPNSATYAAALKACGLISNLVLGRALHSEITEFSAQVVTCLVDFYGKCGSMVEARLVFDLHPEARDVATWNALLAGYGNFGDSDTASKLFEAMQDEGFRPDAVTFVCMLSCCSHAGLVERARECFELMNPQYGVTPDVMHYSCMIDVLGRANLLDEALVLLLKMPCSPDAVTWMALLGACRKWKNVEIGKVCSESLVGKDENFTAAHMLMAHIYGSKGMCVEQERILGSGTKIRTWKLPGQTYILNEMGKMVKFVVGEQGPLEVEEKMQQLCKAMKERGYDAEPYSMTGSGSDVAKDEVVCGHSERRAAVYGILKTPPGEPIRVFKDMRMCDGCHGFTKMISRLSGRALMVRDASRFHVMVNGNCSCKDYW